MGNLCCCLPVALADLMFFPVHVQISHEEPQLNWWAISTVSEHRIVCFTMLALCVWDKMVDLVYHNQNLQTLLMV